MINAFRYFYHVCRLGSVRRASDALGLSPSSVSRQVHLLEQQVGTALLVRTATGVTLTSAGELVAEFAKNVVLDFDSLRSDLDDMRGTGRAMIRIGVIESLVATAPMRAILEFRARHPGSSFRLTVLTTPEVGKAVKAGSCDIGLTLTTEDDAGLRVLKRVPEDVVAAVPRDHEFSARSFVDLQALSSVPIALHESDHGLRQMLERAARLEGVAINPVLSSSSLDALRAFVRMGAGCAIMTRRGALAGDAGDTMVPVPLQAAGLGVKGLDLVMMTGRRPSRMMRLFIEELMAQLDR